MYKYLLALFCFGLQAALSRAPMGGEFNIEFKKDSNMFIGRHHKGIITTMVTFDCTKLSFAVWATKRCNNFMPSQALTSADPHIYELALPYTDAVAFLKNEINVQREKRAVHVYR